MSVPAVDAPSTPKAVVARLFDEVVNRQRFELLDELLTDDVVIHTSVPGVAPGRDGARAFIGVFFGAFPEQRTDVHELIAEGDRVAVRHTHHVRHDGPFMGTAPTGRTASVDGIEIFRVADGRIAEMWHQDDLFSLVVQLGIVAPPGAATQGAR